MKLLTLAYLTALTHLSLMNVTIIEPIKRRQKFMIYIVDTYWWTRRA